MTHPVLPIGNLRERIQAQYATLTGADRKLADVVLGREQEVLTYSATELAALAGVSKASCARFFRRLGFADYQAFRQHVREAAASPSPLGRMSRAPGTAGALAQHLTHDAVQLQALSTHVNDAAVQAAAQALLAAKRVWVVGYRNGYMTAFYAHALLAQVRGHVTLLNDGSGEDAERLADIQPGDVLLAIDFRRRTHRLTQVARYAGEAGARLVLLTDTHLNPLAGTAQVVLTCPHADDTVFDSYVGAVSLVNFLATTALQRAPAKARQRLARIEQAHALLTDLEP